jgi:hypothetical protein
MTLGFSMLKNIFLLHSKMGTQALVIIKLNNIFPLHTNCKTLISSIPMCYTKCHDVNNVSLRKVTDVDE